MGFSNATVVKNMIWRYGERFLAQFVTFLVTLVLARILSPSDYGVVALITVVVTMLEVFSTRGYNQALIQKEEVDHLDYSTVFFINMGINGILYIIVYFCAPLIAKFYGNSQLVVLLRVLALRLIVSGFNSIQQAFVQRNMLFKKFFYSTLIGTLISGVIGIAIAIMGGGPWAIVIQSLTNATVDMLVLFFTIEWKPKLEFSEVRLVTMSGYGIKMLLMGILDSIYENIRSLIIGKKYTSENLAYYNKGQSLPNMIIVNTQVAASNVFFSALSRENENFKGKMRTYLSMMFYFLCPTMVGMACVSSDIITILFSSKWLPAAPFMIVYCFSYLCWVPQMPILQALNASNKAGRTLVLSIIHRTLGIILLFLLINRGPFWIAIGALIADVLCTILVYLFGNHLLGYKLSEIIEDVYKSVISVLVMTCIVMLLSKIISNLVFRLVIEVLVGVITYLLCSWILKDNNLKYICKIKTILGMRKNG